MNGKHRIPITLTQGAEARDISDAISEFFDKQYKGNTMRYFGRIDLEQGEYLRLLRLDSSKNIGQSYAAASDTWKDSESAFEAPLDTTYYDELTEDQAFEVMKRMKETYYKG